MDGIGSLQSNDSAFYRKYPSVAEFNKKTTNDFLDVLRDFSSDKKDITIDGKYYEDKNSIGASMMIANYASEKQNINSSFLNLTNEIRDMEKQVEKLVG